MLTRPPATRFLILAFLLSALLSATAAPLQRWVYCSQNLWVERNVDRLESIMRRAAKAGYTHILLADSKFGKLGDMDARYFRNVDRVKQAATELKLELVPALFGIGYSNDLLWHDPNLIEGLPARDAPLVVRDGAAAIEPDPDIAFPGGDFSDLRKWSWKDEAVASVEGAATVTDAKGRHCRIVQKLRVKPFRQYHISVRVRTRDWRGTPEVKVLAGKASLNHNHLGVRSTQDWTVHHVVFNSLDHSEVNVYFGCWDAGSGTLQWDDARIEEAAFLNLIRRDGAPLSIRRDDGRELVEGVDFEPLTDPRMGVKPWKGSYDIYHQPPALKLKTPLPDGTRLRASWFHAATVHNDQAMICPSEPRTLELLRDQARRMHAAWGARGYMMSHDEIRVLNWCDACQRRGLDAGEILAKNVRACVRILREVNSGGDIHVWSDMFDPHHNAHDNYYLVRGNLAGSWEGLDKDVVVLPWYFGKREATLKFFAERGNRQVIAGYYDQKPERIRDWLQAATPHAGILGVMYTTWQNNYDDLETFAEAVREFEAAR